MRILKRTVLGFAGTCLLVFSPLAQAQQWAGPDGPQEGSFKQHMHELFASLNLTEDQKKQLEANKKQHRAIMVRIRQEMKSDREALRVELMKPELDLTKVNTLSAHIKILLSQMEDDRLSSILAVRSILTPDQYIEFIKMTNQHRRMSQPQ